MNEPNVSTLLAQFLRELLALLFTLLLSTAVGLSAGSHSAHQPALPQHRVPIIDVTDLYHPHQDPGDNFDLITAYALPEVDLKAVILDTHESFRSRVSNHPILRDADKNGPRDPGFIPVLQLNYIFNRNVPVATGPFTMMKSPDDTMLDAPTFQQQGVELILRVLAESPEPVSILSFGSSRPVAVAFNRDPGLFHRKLKRIYLSAGSASPGFLEWNIALDPNAALRLLRSDLPIDLFPCATKDGPFSYNAHNSYWSLPDLRFTQGMNTKLRSYLDYAFTSSSRIDFLHAMDEDPPLRDVIHDYPHPHHVWETAVWMAVSDRRLVRRHDGGYRILPAPQVAASDDVLPGELDPAVLHVTNDALFTFVLSGNSEHIRIYDREDPAANQEALREALPALYLSFRP